MREVVVRETRSLSSRRSQGSKKAMGARRAG